MYREPLGMPTGFINGSHSQNKQKHICQNPSLCSMFVLRCINATHIMIIAPTQNKAVYVSRHSDRSINVHVICRIYSKVIRCIVKAVCMMMMQEFFFY